MRSKDVAFIVLMAGPGVRGDSVLIAQIGLAARAAGASEETAARKGELQAQILAAVQQERDSAAAATRIHQLIREGIAELPEEQRRALGDPDGLAEASLRMVQSPWMRSFSAMIPGRRCEGCVAGACHQR